MRTPKSIGAYNRESVIIAQRFNLKVDDLFAVMTRAGADKYFRTDGVHFNGAGDELLGQAVANVIRPSLNQPRTATQSPP